MEDINKTIILGGGITGMLLALKLSYKAPAHPLLLIDSNSFLGGRVFSEGSGTSGSGFGFEVFHPDDLEAILRHIQVHLSEEEKEEFEEGVFCKEKEKRHCYFFRKSAISLEALLSTPSDFFRKQDVHLFFDFLEFLRSQDLNQDSIVQCSFWTNLDKETQSSFSSVFETIWGSGWEKFSLRKFSEEISLFFSQFQSHIPSLFFRESEIGIKIKNILEKRGVQILLNTTVTKVIEVTNGFEIHFYTTKELKLDLSKKQDEEISDKKLERKERIGGSQKENSNQKKINLLGVAVQESLIFKNISIHAKEVFSTIPLFKQLGIVSRSLLSTGQLRVATKVRPQSLIVVECLSAEVSSALPLGSRILFPVEKVQAHLTYDGSYLFFSYLDYETSLQAPLAAQTVTRIKRAIQRFLGEKTLNKVKVILIPIANTLPFSVKISGTTEIACAQKGFYCCGDSFLPSQQQPWQRIVDSVHDASSYCVL